MELVTNRAGYVEKILIKFEHNHQGKHKRESETNFSELYPGCTSIERVMFQYSLSKKSKGVGNTAKVIQFPLS